MKSQVCNATCRPRRRAFWKPCSKRNRWWFRDPTPQIFHDIIGALCPSHLHWGSGSGQLWDVVWRSLAWAPQGSSTPSTAVTRRFRGFKMSKFGLVPENGWFNMVSPCEKAQIDPIIAISHFLEDNEVSTDGIRQTKLVSSGFSVGNHGENPCFLYHPQWKVTRKWEYNYYFSNKPPSLGFYWVTARVGSWNRFF